MTSVLCSEASSSSTPPSRSWTYHVFLSFRGQDTRTGFTDHLYASLQRKGIITFRDDHNLERGDVISDKLVKAIEGSMFALIVLSPNYASSSWCLDELLKILECSNNPDHGLSVVPVFYGVDPSDVRHLKGTFDQAFRNHQLRFGQDSDKVRRWRHALTKVASYSGWESKNWHEATLVESIAQHIHRKLIPKLPSCTENLVGIESRVEEVTRLLGVRSNDVRFIGIWGMGGIGKTTIARAVYEAIESEFQVSCFLANIREMCETTNGLVQMQRNLVARTHISTSTLNDEYDGKRVIQNSLCNKKVLLVLDDVSDTSHLENLAGKQDWFGLGSRVIITSRDLHLLKTHGVYTTYEVECLGQNEALSLFCLKAFKQYQPEEGYFEMSNEVTKYAGGLPLALKILGSFLNQRTIDIWHSAVKKMKSIPHSKILDTLKISYEGLDFIQQNIFLDVACFFKGKNKDEVIDILEKRGYNPQIEIDVLIERSLITIIQGNIEMHDLLQEMGRHIVIQESPDNPRKRSRLWSIEDIDVVLTKNKGTKTIQSIVFICDFPYKADWRDTAFLNISRLSFLCLEGVNVSIHLYLPCSLKVLHLKKCSLEALSLVDQHHELVEIKMYKCDIVQLWHGKKSLKKLKYIDLNFCLKLKETPDLSGVPNLETLRITCCDNLTDIHPSTVHHKSLVVLDIRDCDSLETLPSKLEMTSLKELLLDECYSLEKLPEFGECMENLARLSLDYTAIRELPTSLGCLIGLSDLSLSGCRKINCFPNGIDGLKSLKVLDISDCPNLLGFLHSLSRLTSLCRVNLRECFPTREPPPHSLGHFMLLTDLDLSENSFVTVPISIDKHPKLRRLGLNRCQNLKLLPKLPSSIRELEAGNCNSLNEFQFNVISKVCRVFTSTSQDHGEVLQMYIPGKEIPTWFVHQAKGKSVSVPFPESYPSKERMGLALCFQLHSSYRYFYARPMVICKCKGFITKRVSGLKPLEAAMNSHLFILCLTWDHFINEFDEDNRFELSFEDDPGHEINILSSAARFLDARY